MGKKITKEMIMSIKEFKKKIGAEKIVLFGSYATGKAVSDSDIDLILVSKSFKGKDFHSRFKGLWLKWELNLPVDFIPYTPEEFQKLSKKPTIVKEALEEGIEI